MRDGAAVLAQVAPERDVPRQPQCHTDGGGPEPVVEAEVSLQQAGDQRTDERAEVDAEVEQREAAVAARIALGVEGSQQREAFAFSAPEPSAISTRPTATPVSRAAARARCGRTSPPPP